MKMDFLPYEKGFSSWVKMDFHPMGITFSRICGVLFLKKVHSWEGVTEMVLGLFLLFL